MASSVSPHKDRPRGVAATSPRQNYSLVGLITANSILEDLGRPVRQVHLVVASRQRRVAVRTDRLRQAHRPRPPLGALARLGDLRAPTGTGAQAGHQMGAVDGPSGSFRGDIGPHHPRCAARASIATRGVDVAPHRAYAYYDGRQEVMTWRSFRVPFVLRSSLPPPAQGANGSDGHSACAHPSSLFVYSLSTRSDVSHRHRRSASRQCYPGPTSYGWQLVYEHDEHIHCIQSWLQPW